MFKKYIEKRAKELLQKMLEDQDDYWLDRRIEAYAHECIRQSKPIAVEITEADITGLAAAKLNSIVTKEIEHQIDKLVTGDEIIGRLVKEINLHQLKIN